MRALFVLLVASLALCACDDGRGELPECPKPPLGGWRTVNVCQSDPGAALCVIGVGKYEADCRIASDGVACVVSCP